VALMEKVKCFADRKDGTCHALIKKKCILCEFYCPREIVKDNPFYEYSYTDKRKMKIEKERRRITENLVMKEND
jgi:hypothetical protein